jgi:hypothetical protein
VSAANTNQTTDYAPEHLQSVSNHPSLGQLREAVACLPGHLDWAQPRLTIEILRFEMGDEYVVDQLTDLQQALKTGW